MRRLNGLVGVVVLGTAALCGGNSLALTDEEIFRAFDFNFVNPGARAVGLGGAYIATADDATAAQANPAALHYVSQMEFFVEYRASNPVTTVFKPTQGTVGNLTLPTPDLPYLNLRTVNAPENLGDVSFASFVFPFKVGKDLRMRLAFSRQIVLHDKTSLSDNGLSTSATFSPQTFPTWVNPDSGLVEQYAVTSTSTGNLDTQIVYYNLGFSSSITRDFSIGATGTWATLDMTSNVTNTITDPRGLLNFVNPRQVTGNGTFGTVTTGSSTNGTDSNFAYTIGLHWHPDSVFPSGVSPIRFGFVYRKGARLAVNETLTETEADGVTKTVTGEFSNVLKVPDRFGIGAAYDFGKKLRWTAALDVERIKFKDLLDGYQKGVNFLTSGNIPSDVLQTDSNKSITYTVDDATVVHAGVEYTNVSRGGWTQGIRVGYYNAPDSRIRMTHFNSGNDAINNLYLDVFRGGENINHYTVGFNVAYGRAPGQSVNLQFAADLSDVSKVYVGSLLWRFGKTR